MQKVIEAESDLDEQSVTLTQAGYDATLGSETTLTRLRAPRREHAIEAWQMMLLRKVREVAVEREVEPRAIALELIGMLEVGYTCVPIVGDVR